ncbi:MAG: PorV/PorQ family protein [Candidatus Eisenbacteria bacterium]|nr:PorV/PorQ family protein [Candidatus Latescibacterota bacterium]MBD3301454.1 PorV/PorQ family protein [Candidatus Eisenbacteria bacterium]
MGGSMGRGRRIPGLLVVACAILLATGPARSAEEFEKVGTVGLQFLKIGIGARATAMGSAFVSVADDATSVYWNPAGIARLPDRSLSFHHVEWYADIQLNQAAYVFSVPFLPGAMALHARSLSMGRQPVRTVFRPDGEGVTHDAGDLSLGFSYARMLTDKFSTGLTIHYLQSTLAEWTSEGIAFDFGTLYDTGYQSLTIGMSIQSIGSQMVFVEDPVKLPTTFRVGMSMDLIRVGAQTLLLAGEFQHPPDNEERGNVGAELSVGGFAFLRGGWYYRYDQEHLSIGGGVRVPSLVGNGLVADYSYTENHDLPGIHRLSLDFRF